jgi:hypothetical protein
MFAAHGTQQEVQSAVPTKTCVLGLEPVHRIQRDVLFQDYHLKVENTRIRYRSNYCHSRDKSLYLCSGVVKLAHGLIYQ